MTKEELLELLDSFINENRLVTEFNTFLEERGYSLKEYDKLIKSL